ncbi:hypothetical protein LXL04_007369 [Taraxacum kok-saghyz]
MDGLRKHQVSLQGSSAKEITRDALLEKVTQEREFRNYMRRATAASLFIQRVWRRYASTKKAAAHLREEWQVMLKCHPVPITRAWISNNLLKPFLLFVRTSATRHQRFEDRDVDCMQICFKILLESINSSDPQRNFCTLATSTIKDRTTWTYQAKKLISLCPLILSECDYSSHQETHQYIVLTSMAMRLPYYPLQTTLPKLHHLLLIQQQWIPLTTQTMITQKSKGQTKEVIYGNAIKFQASSSFEIVVTSDSTPQNPNSAPNNSVNNFKNNDPSMFLVSTHLTGNENFMQWKFSIRIALGAKKKIGFIDGTTKKPDTEGSDLDDWIKIVSAFVFSTTARDLWLDLEEHFGESNGPLIYQLQREIASINQGDSSLSKYYTKLKQLWDQLSCLVVMPSCTCGFAKAVADLTSST